MITVVAKSNVLPEKREEFLKLAREMEQKSRQERGCISYTLYESMDNPNQFCYIEFWKDADALEAHNNSEHFLSLVPKMNQLKKEPSHVELYHEITEQ